MRRFCFLLALLTSAGIVIAGRLDVDEDELFPCMQLPTADDATQSRKPRPITPDTWRNPASNTPAQLTLRGFSTDNWGSFEPEKKVSAFSGFETVMDSFATTMAADFDLPATPKAPPIQRKLSLITRASTPPQHILVDDDKGTVFSLEPAENEGEFIAAPGAQGGRDLSPATSNSEANDGISPVFHATTIIILVLVLAIGFIASLVR